jgi:predicted ATP-dependent endonuclease of OLD family
VRIQQIKVMNFRLLADVELVLEDQSTLVVGRNNSGKTALSEVVRRFLSESTPSFHLEDFSNACYDDFVEALAAFNNNSLDENVIRPLIPAIELRLVFKYDAEQPEFGPLAPFVIDLDQACTTALVIVRYELKDGGIEDFFKGQPAQPLDETTKSEFFRIVRERIPSLFVTNIWAQDPNDPENRRQMPTGSLRGLVKAGFINAQRGLDDITSRESDILAKVLEGLFVTASSPMADTEDRAIVDALTKAVQEIQSQLDTTFEGQLKSLLPTLQSFGYPGLGGQELHTETILDVRRLLSNFTKVRYAGYGGIALPESYNGLGVRNLIFILLQLVGFCKAFRAEKISAGVHIIFIEEPEAHLHPQMQEVFIRQLANIAQHLSVDGETPTHWPVQFVVSTHSPHVANEAGFETIRYFLCSTTATDSGSIRQTKIKDLRDGLKGIPEDKKKFLHQYLTLTRCDLFFADKAVLVEGLSERLLLPKIIHKLEQLENKNPKLSSQYLTVMEVGGAYAHLFFDLLEFLELRTLIITDLDSVTKPGGTSCAVHAGTASSNACIKKWFSATGSQSLADLICKDDQAKINGRQRIAYQCAESNKGPCGRTFEDAFILANPAVFAMTKTKPDELELEARELASSFKKSEFALKFAIENTDWVAPKYVLDGIRWLSKDEGQAADVPTPVSTQATGGARA